MRLWWRTTWNRRWSVRERSTRQRFAKCSKTGWESRSQSSITTAKIRFKNRRGMRNQQHFQEDSDKMECTRCNKSATHFIICPTCRNPQVKCTWNDERGNCCICADKTANVNIMSDKTSLMNINTQAGSSPNHPAPRAARSCESSNPWMADWEPKLKVKLTRRDNTEKEPDQKSWTEGTW